MDTRDMIKKHKKIIIVAGLAVLIFVAILFTFLGLQKQEINILLKYNSFMLQPNESIGVSLGEFVYDVKPLYMGWGADYPIMFSGSLEDLYTQLNPGYMTFYNTANHSISFGLLTHEWYDVVNNSYLSWQVHHVPNTTTEIWYGVMRKNQTTDLTLAGLCSLSCENQGLNDSLTYRPCLDACYSALIVWFRSEEFGG